MTARGASVVRRARGLVVGVAAVLCLLALAGCASSPGPGEGLRTIAVDVHGPNKILVGGRQVSGKNLPRRLKALGASPRTEIRLVTPATINAGAMRYLTGHLISRGFRRVVLVEAKE